jgi:hypothetical protein
LGLAFPVSQNQGPGKLSDSPSVTLMAEMDLNPQLYLHTRGISSPAGP